MTFETNHSTNPYWDNNQEIYARIANFRQNFQIDPTHTYTEEEVFDLRMRYVDEVIKLQKEIEQTPKRPSPSKISTVTTFATVR